MLTLVFVFILFNLTSIWNLPTISIGDRWHDGIPSLVGFFVHGRARKWPHEVSLDGGRY